MYLTRDEKNKSQKNTVKSKINGVAIIFNVF